MAQAAAQEDETVQTLKDAPSADDMPSRKNSAARRASAKNPSAMSVDRERSARQAAVQQQKGRRNSRDMLKRPSVFAGAGQRPTGPSGAARPSVYGAARMSIAPTKKAPPPQRKGKEPVGSYLLGDMLGRGQFGIVHRGVNSENGEFVAIKQMKTDKINEQALQSFEAEIKLLENLHHENIVRYLTVVRTSQHLNLVLEYCEGGCLTDLLKKFGNFPERLAAVYIAQTLRGLEYLHSKDVVHRDIKGANILLTKSGSVKVADFGISLSNQSTDIAEAGVGSPYWMAPEVIQMEDTITVKADIWSLGSTVVELVTGKPPYSEFHPMGAIVRCAQDEHPPLPKDISPELEDFLLRCFQKDISKRASATELLSHPWFTAVKQQGGSDEAAAATATATTTTEKKAPPSIRVHGPTIRTDSPFKTVFLTSSTTCAEALQVALKKYGVDKEKYHQYALFQERDTGEIRMLDDNEMPLQIADRWGQDRYHYIFSVRKRPAEEKRKEGMVLRKEVSKGFFGSRTRWVPRMFIVDSEEKYISFLHSEDSSEYEKPLYVIYNLNMVKEVLQVTNDPNDGVYEFAIVDRTTRHLLSVESSEEMTAWICIIQEACGLNRPTVAPEHVANGTVPPQAGK